MKPALETGGLPGAVSSVETWGAFSITQQLAPTYRGQRVLQAQLGDAGACNKWVANGTAGGLFICCNNECCGGQGEWEKWHTAPAPQGCAGGEDAASEENGWKKKGEEKGLRSRCAPSETHSPPSVEEGFPPTSAPCPCPATAWTATRPPPPPPFFPTRGGMARVLLQQRPPPLR